MEWTYKLLVFLPIGFIQGAYYFYLNRQCQAGPNDNLADKIFQMLAVTGVVFPALVLFLGAPFFWATLTLCFIYYCFTFSVFSSLLGKLLSDKTGFGAIMFPAWIAMTGFMGAVMIRGAYHLYLLLSS